MKSRCVLALISGPTLDLLIKGGRSLFNILDAIAYQVAEKQQALRNKGYWVTPILTISYQAESYHSLKLTRERFKNDLQTYLGDDYLRLMKLLRSLPPSVDPQKYQHYLEQWEQSDMTDAAFAWRYWGQLWQVI